MTRSKNSRKGKYKKPGSCWCRKCRNNKSKVYHRRQEMLNALHFYDFPFYLTHGKDKKQSINLAPRASWGNWYKEHKQKELEVSRKSYREWTWLKGKPNKKGWDGIKRFVWWKYHHND
jgi:hypothetical protein